MIYSRLIGGLGNQMFQYAAGASLAAHNNSKLKLDISGFEDYKLHNGYELALFNINAEIADKKEITSLVNSQSRLSRFIHRKFNINKQSHYLEKAFTFDPNFFNTKAPVYIDGYWQSYKYFESVEQKIRQELTFVKPFSDKNSQIADELLKLNAVSIHVRRGDYVNNKHTNSVHGLCSLDYYRGAIEKIHEHVENPVFYFFSDDMKWVKENLAVGKNSVFVDHNTGKDSYNDMRLMSMCQHHVIANSSFSWWGAWLGSNTNKIVVAPKQWFLNNTDTSDLIPPSWFRV